MERYEREEESPINSETDVTKLLLGEDSMGRRVHP